MQLKLYLERGSIRHWVGVSSGTLTASPLCRWSTAVATDLIVRKIGLPRSLSSLRAAQYVRMSDDHQRYSIENQAAVIATYAQLRGLQIVHTYRDEGETG